VSRFRFVEDHRDAYGVKRLCRVLEIERSSYYKWRAGAQVRQARQETEEQLAAEIATIHSRHRGSYGSPRVHRELRRRGRRVNRKRVERIMRHRGIVGVTRRRRRSLTKQDAAAAPAPDLLKRDFSATVPGTKLVGDITYLPTGQGWLYLATVLDLATREVIGYAMAEHMRAELVVQALEAAARRHRLAPGCIFHSDRGSQYTSGEFRAVLARLGMRQSMGRTGSCYDNSAAESLFATLKTEVGTVAWPSRAKARTEVFFFIEVYYNRQRLHSTIGYRTPHEMRLMLQSTQSLVHNG
jgi:putative transposase